MPRRVASTWLLQLPWLTGEQERIALREEPGSTSPQRVPREFDELLERWGADHPLLLVTEDLHRSDTATLRLNDHVARRRGPVRLLWLAGFRLAEVVAQDHPLRWLRQELHLHRLAEEAGLAPPRSRRSTTSQRGCPPQQSQSAPIRRSAIAMRLV